MINCIFEKKKCYLILSLVFQKKIVKKNVNK